MILFIRASFLKIALTINPVIVEGSRLDVSSEFPLPGYRRYYEVYNSPGTSIVRGEDISPDRRLIRISTARCAMD
jgi:hypothetical protein